MAAILDRIRASPVVHADETGWRQNGRQRRYVWTFSYPTERFLPDKAGSGQGGGGRSSWASRSPECWSAISTPPTTITMAPSNGAGPTCCGISTTWWRSTPRTPTLAQWAAAVHQLYVEARSFTHPQAQRRRTAQLAWERQLLVICQPFLADPLALQGRLCRRIERHIKELFVFVAEPDVPSDNEPRRAQPAPIWLSAARSAAASRSANCWYRAQDDAGIHLRHLARTMA